MGTVIQHHQTAVQRIDLMHPTEHAPASAHQVGWYTQNGRVVGMKLEFAGGHVACLTYREIGELREAAETFDSE